jgi:hypothetical protein
MRRVYIGTCMMIVYEDSVYQHLNEVRDHDVDVNTPRQIRQENASTVVDGYNHEPV